LRAALVALLLIAGCGTNEPCSMIRNTKPCCFAAVDGECDCLGDAGWECGGTDAGVQPVQTGDPCDVPGSTTATGCLCVGTRWVCESSDLGVTLDMTQPVDSGASD
jgi:hypothetical protein